MGENETLYLFKYGDPDKVQSIQGALIGPPRVDQLALEKEWRKDAGKGRWPSIHDLMPWLIEKKGFREADPALWETWAD